MTYVIGQGPFKTVAKAGPFLLDCPVQHESLQEMVIQIREG